MIPDHAAGEFVTIRRLAQELGVSVRTARRWTLENADPLPGFKPTARTILIRRADFEAWLERRRAIGREEKLGERPRTDRISGIVT